ncbi:VOC family protein [Saccharicrinis sp. FJH2]|uniref:VOC family protein n=1 Tax=Saccharicrinis sp. FJH65 TaxID=3344659 RepID=UPI0035F3D53F
MHIQELTIYTSQLSEQISFYSNILGLKTVKENHDSVSYGIGHSILTFQHAPETTPYHFAINIPCNQIEEALVWAKKNLEILPFEGSEIQNFNSWNARAFYFYDRDKNIVELIARQNLHNESNDVFSEHSFLEISEIGLPVDDIAPVYRYIHRSTGLDIYSGDIDRFCAIGNEHGLFVCINKHKKDWIPTMEKAYSSAFELQFAHNKKEWIIEFNGQEPEIKSLK